MNNYNNDYGVTNHENGVEFYCDINKKPKEKKMSKNGDEKDEKIK